MLNTYNHNGKRFLFDPETAFWAIIDDARELKLVKDFLTDREDVLKKELDKYRFEVKPETVYINVTDLCNSECPYCYIPEEVRRRGRTMKRDELFEILSRLEGNVKWVVFHGSEPLIAKDLVFEAIEEFKFNYGIQTNAKLLEKEDMDFLIDRKVNVGISLDSPHRETNDITRGKGQFDCAVKAIEYMKGYKKLSVITTINRFNYHHLSDMIDFLAGKVRLVLMNPVRGTSEGGRKLMADPDRSAEEFVKACKTAINHTKNGNRIVIGDFANIILGFIAPTSRVLQCDISPCGGGRRFLAISTEGIYPCSEFIGVKEFRTELKTDTFNITEIMVCFQELRNRTVEKIEECRECSFRHICGSPCPAEVFSMYGNLLTKSPSCNFYKKVIEFAIQTIIRGEHRYVINEDSLKVKYDISTNQTQ
jgi:uncharacterized protein